MAKKQRALPQHIYVYEEQDKDAAFLCACYDEADAADRDARLVGVYTLKEVRKIVLAVTDVK